MKTFKKWDGKHIEDWGAYMSDDGKSFYRAFKNYLKRTFPEAEVIDFKPNHYDASGFLKFPNGFCIYVSHNIDRYKQSVDFSASGALYGVLFRFAKDEKDFHGEVNNFSSIYDLEKSIRGLIARRAA